MKKIAMLLKSRTAWSIVFMALFNGLDAIKDVVPAAYQPYITPIVAVLALYFRANPQARA